MDKSHIDPVADMLLGSYLDTSSYSRQFLDVHGQPPTVMAKAHNLRAVLQAKIHQADEFQLGEPFAEYGRVEFTGDSIEGRLLLRSMSAVRIEEAQQTRRPQLFDSEPYFVDSAVTLLIYEFKAEGLILWSARTRKAETGTRLIANGPAELISLWPYDYSSTSQFSQDEPDAFGDIGDVDIDGEEDEG